MARASKDKTSVKCFVSQSRYMMHSKIMPNGVGTEIMRNQDAIPIEETNS